MGTRQVGRADGDRHSMGELDILWAGHWVIYMVGVWSGGEGSCVGRVAMVDFDTILKVNATSIARKVRIMVWEVLVVTALPELPSVRSASRAPYS
jgi:hypothetical protein